MTATTSGTLRGLIRSGGIIAVAMGVMNVATYAFTILAARLLGPSEYSAVASLMGLLLVVNVLALGLQATGARRVASDPEDRDRIEASVMAVTYRAAAGIGLLCLLLTPVIAWVLSLDSWYAAAMIGVSAVPLTLMGGQAGILQGEERWAPLAGIYLAMGLGRVGLGVLLMLAVPTAFGAMLAVAVGALLPAAVGAVALGRVRTGRRSAMPAERRVFGEVAGNSHALLAFFALSNLDVVLARVVFDAHEAGLYAGGLILTKAVLFLPQFVVVIAFPSMAASHARHRMYLKALVLVGLLGVLATAGAALLNQVTVGPEETGLTVAFIGGSAYAEVSSYLWMFAGLGTLLALIQLMVYEVVARQHRAAVLLVWAGLLAVGGVAVVVTTGQGLLYGVGLAYASVLGALLATALLRPGPRQ